MLLIADSGSTKTTWCLVDNGGNARHFVQTSGINPYYQHEEEILEKLRTEFRYDTKQMKAIFFYGAGCTSPTVNQVVQNALSRFFETETIEVGSDLFAAARSLCGHQPGIACILGTGSNSCFYDGEQIVQNVSPLGFILGDEASGAVLGRKLLGDVLKNQLPAALIEAFFAENQVSPAEIMDNIYRKPFPNRYAAHFSRFIFDHIGEPEMKNRVFQEFQTFFKRNVLQYPQARLHAIHFTGSIAFYFQELLREVAVSLELKVGNIVKEPINGLVNYHVDI
jgi:glucosamine kinase